MSYFFIFKCSLCLLSAFLFIGVRHLSAFSLSVSADNGRILEDLMNFIVSVKKCALLLLKAFYAKYEDCIQDIIVAHRTKRLTERRNGS